jgi:iron complex transport system substrate-binding protein
MSAKQLFRLVGAGLLLLSLWACESRSKQKPQAGFITVTDDLGRRVQVPRQPRRVMGLAPSATEMLFAVADEDQIVGRTQACNYPARVKNKPMVNTYPMDYEQLVMLKPDLVVTMAGMTSPEAAARLTELQIPVYFQKFERVEDVLRGLTDLGRLLHRQERARKRTDSLQAELARLQAQVAATRHAGPRPRVLAITWTDPIYVYGRNTLFTDKLQWIGAENALTDTFAQPYPALTREYILQLNPDIIIGGSFEKMEAAVDDDLMTRPGPRVVASIRQLNGLIH